MTKKNNLFEDLDIDKEQQNPCGPLDIDIQAVRCNVHAKLDSAYTERKSVIMKSKKKVSIIAIAAAFVLGATVFAANGIVSTWFSSSSSIPDYTSLPTEKQVIKDIGYRTVLIDAFDNGYVFKDGNIVNNNFTDGSSSVEKFKSVSFRYEKDADDVTFSQDKFSSDMSEDGSVIKNVNGCDIYYYSYTNKIVPPDYQQTDEDKKAEANGELVFSYGSAEVEISKVQSVTWKKDGIMYQLLQIDGKLSPDELVQMAEECLAK